jgi:hypothetical protein
MRCRAHGGMKIGTSGRPDNCNRVGLDTVSGETRLFSRENAECRMPGRGRGQYLSNNVVSLRLHAVEMRLRRSPHSVSLLFFWRLCRQKNNRETIFTGTQSPRPLREAKLH